MRTMIINCDRCGKAIEGYPVKIIPKHTSRETGELWTDECKEENIAYEEEMIDKDFCVDCVKKILRYAVGGMKPNPEFEQAVHEMVEGVTPHEKPEGAINMAQIDKLEELVGEPKKGRQKIDVGKVMALTRAGWSAAKIAEEMGINIQSVYDVRCRLKKEGKM